MTLPSDRDHVPASSPLSRRTMLAASAFAVPAVVVAGTSPAFAASQPDSLALTLSPSTVAAGETTDVVAKLTDSAGAPKVGQSVTLTSSSSSVTFSSSTGVTQSDGTFRTKATVASSAATGKPTISAVSGGLTAVSTLTVDTFAITTSVSTVSGGGMRVISTVRDSARKVVVGRTVTFSSPTPGVSFDSPSGVTDSNGQRISTFSATNATPASATIVGTSGGVSSSAPWPILSITGSPSPSSMQSYVQSHSTLPLAVKYADGRVFDATSLSNLVWVSTDYPNGYIGTDAQAGVRKSQSFTLDDNTKTATAYFHTNFNVEKGAAKVTVKCNGTVVTRTITIT